MEPIFETKASRFHSLHLFNRLRNSSLIKNVVIVMSGTVTAQIIGFAMSPIISRLFTPSEFGVFGSFNSVFTIIAAGATLQYSQAIMLPKENEEAFNLFLVSCFSTLGMGFLCLIVCLVAPTYLNSLIKAEGIWALALLVVAIVVVGFSQSIQAWCVRVKAFKQTSFSQIIRSLSSNGGQIGFGFLKGGAVGLIVSSVLADLLACLNLARVVFSDFKTLRQGIRWVQIKELAKEYRDFPMYATPQNVINAFSSGLPVLLLAHFYGIGVAGAYTFGLRILQIPMGIVLGALRQVVFQKAGETQHLGGRLAPLYIKITLGLFTIIFFPSLILLIWAPQIFKIIFGSQWYVAGEFARWLILWLMFYFCNLPAVLFGRLLRIQRTIFFYDIILLITRTSVLLLGGVYLSTLQTIIIFSLVGAVMNTILIIMVGYAVMNKEGHVNFYRIKEFLIKD